MTPPFVWGSTKLHGATFPANLEENWRGDEEKKRNPKKIEMVT